MKVHLWKSASGAGRQKTGQSIRGKISGPIPIPNPVDDEFPMRNPGTGIATPLPTDGKEPQFPIPQPEQEQPPSSSSTTQQVVPGVSGPRPEVAHNAQTTESTPSPPQSGTRSSGGPSPTSGLTGHSPQRRTNQSSALRYSIVSASSQRTGTTSNKDVPQRKKSTIRGALSRLFGRRKKSGSQGSVEDGAIGSTQHRSDPTALNRTGKDGEPKRSASLPITEYDRALRSHSVGPEDITAIESARNSVNAEFAFTRRRANTTTSHIYPAPRTREGEFSGLSPRPASTHGRGSRLLGLEDDPNEIGRAITSDSVGLRRRSRSLSGIPDAIDTRGQLRRRSDEIRYWRESYDPAFMSPMSSNAPDNDDTGVMTMDLARGAPSIDRPKTPPQPFNFGSIASMNEMAGMKITQAASLETRIGNLEARMRRMEKVVTQLANTVPDFRLQVEAPDTGPSGPPAEPAAGSEPSIAYTMVTTNTTSTAPLNPSLYQTAPPDVRPSTAYSGSRQSEDSHMSFGEAPTFIGSLHPSAGHVPLQAQAQATRPTSNSTVRGATSLPMLPREITGPFTADHYTTLLALIETERTQRQVLEAQVKKMSNALSVFSSQSAGTIQLEPPPTARSFGNQSAFDHDSTEDEEDDNATEDEGTMGEAKKSKGKPLAAEDSGIAGGQEREDDDYSEAFATPREEQPHSYGAFGEELREDDGDGNRRKAARTLSLSQLTVGKPQSPVHAAQNIGSI